MNSNGKPLSVGPSRAAIITGMNLAGSRPSRIHCQDSTVARPDAAE
jgi:hypothetical protein